ncbi:unnamed protein product [Acanthocheilonema viteae]|uniref:Uncharacterized protein n=1 Tax=Acanthocheilonema viteae TaxID=6277 RepID=A0A498SPN1_ACAVI|nr:unnamed protein product [Acanthocheilonema viteae]
MKLVDIGSILIYLLEPDYFFDFMSPNEIHNMKSGLYLLNTKVGPIITGKDISTWTKRRLWNSSNKISLKRTKDTKLLAVERLKKQMQLNIIEEVPHHEVLTPCKSTTKLRIIYNVSAHFKGMKSLNDVLRDPTTLSDLADASYVAYSAAIYYEIMELIRTFLIFAKSCIAPIKGITILRLELLAIPIGVRAVEFVINQLEYENVPIT